MCSFRSYDAKHDGHSQKTVIETPRIGHSIPRKMPKMNHLMLCVSTSADQINTFFRILRAKQADEICVFSVKMRVCVSGSRHFYYYLMQISSSSQQNAE